MNAPVNPLIADTPDADPYVPDNDDDRKAPTTAAPMYNTCIKKQALQSP